MTACIDIGLGFSRGFLLDARGLKLLLLELDLHMSFIDSIPFSDSGESILDEKLCIQILTISSCSKKAQTFIFRDSL